MKKRNIIFGTALVSGTLLLLAGCGEALSNAPPGSATTSSNVTAATTSVETAKPTAEPTQQPTINPSIAQVEAYRVITVRNGHIVSLDFTSIGNDAQNLSAMETDLATAGVDIQTWLDEIGAVQVPQVLAKVDSLMRQALSTDLAGTTLILHGLQTSSFEEVNAGGTQLQNGTKLTQQATAEMNRIG